MKQTSSFVIAALFGAVAATEITYDASLKCGKCIKGGFNFCHNGATDGVVVTTDDVEPTYTCCEDDTCAEASNADYTCSLTYSDATYALQMCPQKQTNCGEVQEVTFEETGEEETLTVSGLTDGESCTYKIKSNKGSPAFKLSDDSTTTDEKAEISYIEFETDKTEVLEDLCADAEDDTECSPEEGLPKKGQSFEDSGNQGEKGGQKKPKRRKADGTTTEDEDIDEEKVYLEEKKEKEELSEEDAAAEEEGGWFKPKKP